MLKKQKKSVDIVDDVVTSGRRKLSPLVTRIIYILGICYATFNIVHLLIYSFGPWVHLPVNLCFASIMCIVMYKSMFEKNRALAIITDIIFAAMAIIGTMYYVFEYREMVFRIGAFPTTYDIIAATLVVIVSLEITRRASGSALAIVGIVFLIYAFWGERVPGFIGHSGFSYERIMSILYGDTGIFGSALSAVSSYVFLFILFGSFLEKLGGGQVFIDLATGIAGHARGGPAKVAVVASALFGTISGSSVANVAGTGSFTIPLMKRIGYRPEFAGGVEASASAGGQIMPPVMGSTAFILAELVGVTYATVALKSLIPASLYFLAIFIMVDLEAVRVGLKGVPKEELPNSWQILKTKWSYLLPIIVIFFSLLVLKTSTSRAALFGILATLIGPIFFSKGTNISIKKLLDAISGGATGVLNIIASCASAGIIIGILALTGLGLKLGTILVDLSKGNLLLMLMASMVLTIILGMGLPTAAAYIVAVSVVGPALTKAGIPMFAAHLFVLYFSVTAQVTPPVALASYTAAGIAQCSASAVGWTGLKLSIAGFIVPYMFIYGPGMILIGTPWEIIYSITCSLIGIVILAMGVMGQLYTIGKVGPIQSILLIASSIMILLPGYLTDALGLALLLGILAVETLLKKRSNMLAR